MGDKKEPSKTTDDVKLSNDSTIKNPLRRAQTFVTWQRVKSIGSEVELSPEAENEFKLKLQKARQRASEGTALSPVTPSPVSLVVTPIPISGKKEVQPKKVEPKPVVTASIEVKPETPKEIPNIEAPQEPKKEEAPIKEEPTKEEPKKEEPKKEEPKKEEPKKEEPKKEEPKKQEPKKFEAPKQEFKKFEPKKEEFKKFEPVKKDIVSPKSPVNLSPVTPSLVSDETKKRVQYGVQFQGFQAISNPIQTRTFGVAKSNANATKNATNQPWQRTSTIADFRVESIQKRESTLKKRDSFVGGTPFQGVVAGDPLAGLEAKRKLSQSIQSKKSSSPLSPSSKEESELAKKFAEKQKQATSPTSSTSPTSPVTTATTTTPAKNTFKRLP